MNNYAQKLKNIAENALNAIIRGINWAIRGIDWLMVVLPRLAELLRKLLEVLGQPVVARAQRLCIFRPKVDPATQAPKRTTKITLQELYSKLYQLAPTAQIWFADSWKWLCAYDDIALFLAQDQTNRAEYMPDEFDCDDYAFRLKGQFSIPQWSNLALGICWTSTHALNFMIAEDGKVLFIEPQSDEITDKPPENIRLLVI